MASRSSTSSSDGWPREVVPRGRMPLAAIALVVAIVAIELVAARTQVWFADLAAWQWRTKRELLDAGRLDGTVAVFGSSVLFHGLDPAPANARGGPRVVNLALNGMELPQSAQLLRERIAAAPPRHVVLELGNVAVDVESWVTGPYYRSWADWRDFTESRFYYWQPALALGFLEQRVSTAYRFREGLDNWIFESARERRPAWRTRDRNRQVGDVMRAHDGMAYADFDTRTLQPDAARAASWRVTTAGEWWLHRFLDDASAAGVAVTLLLPPSPPVDDESDAGVRASFDAYVLRLRHQYPQLALDVLAPSGFALDEFADDVHVNARGRAHLSDIFARWVAP